MSHTVSRPELGDMRATHEDFFPMALGEVKETLAQRTLSTRVLFGLVGESRVLLGYASWFAPQSQLLHDCVRLHGQAAYGCARVIAGSPGDAIEVRLGDETVSVVRDEHARVGSVAEWADAWCAALAARDEATLAGMRPLPTAQFHDARVQIDEYQYALAEAFLAIKDDRDDCLAAVARARELWKRRTVAKKSAADIAAALLTVIEALVGGEAAAFNDALYRALVAHAKHWSKGDDILHARGWVALRHVGLACLALDRGIAIEIESPYLPRALVESKFFAEPSLGRSRA